MFSILTIQKQSYRIFMLNKLIGKQLMKILLYFPKGVFQEPSAFLVLVFMGINIIMKIGLFQILHVLFVPVLRFHSQVNRCIFLNSAHTQFICLSNREARLSHAAKAETYIILMKPLALKLDQLKSISAALPLEQKELLASISFT